MTDDYPADLARGAGELLQAIQWAATSAEVGTAALKNKGDAASQAYLNGRLEAERPHDAILSEEAVDSDARLTASRVWIIDPLDGTREFSEGRDDWAVHVALWEGGELTAAAVGLPGIDLILTTDGPPAPQEVSGRIRLAVSRSRPPALVGRLAEILDCELVPMGSAGFKVAAVVRGEVDAYVHSGGQYEWDSAAPVAVARRAGLFASRIDGSELVYNQPDPYLPDLVVCKRSIAQSVLATIEKIRAEEKE